MKKVSIIIPCYNVGNIIEETFQSLENQTCKDFEVILINDGSSDDTLCRLRAFKERTILEVYVLDKENGGVSSARNLGIRKAKCNYILFLDSDDIYHKDFVKLMLNTVECATSDVVFCRLSRNINLIRKTVSNNIEITPQDLNQTMYKLLYEMGEYGFYCYLYKRDILTQNSLFFDESTKYGEDREFIWKYLTHCGTYTWIDAALYGYRDTPGSALKRTPYERVNGLEAIRRTYEYMKEQNFCYAEEYWNFMYPRGSWALMKNFALYHSKENFRRASEEIDIEHSMRALARSNDGYVKLFAICYLINPMLFYYLIALIGYLQRK